MKLSFLREIQGKAGFIILQLPDAEQQWLDDYRQTLNQRFPGIVEQLIIFGSKARGEATADSDLDVMLIIHSGTWIEKEALTGQGHLLAVGTDVVPSFVVYIVDEWETRRQNQSPLWQTTIRDGVAV